jgi:hypothetical protein
MEKSMTRAQRAQLEFLRTFQPYLSASGPLCPAPAERLYQAPRLEEFLGRALSYWMNARPKRALADLHQWTRPPALVRSQPPEAQSQPRSA